MLKETKATTAYTLIEFECNLHPTKSFNMQYLAAVLTFD